MSDAPTEREWMTAMIASEAVAECEQCGRPFRPYDDRRILVEAEGPAEGRAIVLCSGQCVDAFLEAE